MHTHNETRTVTMALAGLCGLGVLTAAVPILASVLLGLLALGMAGLLVVGARLWRTTRYQVHPTTRRADTDTAVLAHAIWQEVA